jgi:hypothetical protein
MRHNGTSSTLGLLSALALALLLLVTLASAAGPEYAVDWWTVDGGGGTSSGGGYALAGTAGQPDAGTPINGGGYAVTGGYWAGAGAIPDQGHAVYLPLVLRNLGQ